MYTLKNQNVELKFTVKKDYPETSEPHFFMLGEPNEESFYLCRELQNKDKGYYVNEATVTNTENTKEKAECIVICKAQTAAEIDMAISLYLKTIGQIEGKDKQIKNEGEEPKSAD